jgi:FkbM family methyltransferase
MKKETDVLYNGEMYKYHYNDKDDSGLGCIKEIVNNNEYHLNDFKDLEDKVFVDLGANHGLVTIILAKQNPKSKVYSFEPNPFVFEYLKMNVDSNNLNNVKLYNKGISNNENESLMLHPYCSGANIIVNDTNGLDNYYHRLGINYETIEIDVMDFNAFLIEENIREISLLKIDCEGCEFTVIPSESFKSTKVDNIVGEFHDLPYYDTPFTAQNLMDICKDKIKGIISVKMLKL